MRRTKIIHFPLVSCVGRGALLLEGVMRSGIVNHFSMTSLIGDLGPSYKFCHLKFFWSSIWLVQCIHFPKPKCKSLLSTCRSLLQSDLLFFPFVLGGTDLPHGPCWVRVEAGHQAGMELIWNHRARAQPLLAENGEKGAETDWGLRAWGQSLQPLGQRSCEFPGSLSLTPCPVG